MPIQIIYVFKCDGCEYEYREGFPIPDGYPIPQARPPAGWKKMPDMIYCPKHEVKIV